LRDPLIGAAFGRALLAGAGFTAILFTARLLHDGFFVKYKIPVTSWLARLLASSNGFFGGAVSRDLFGRRRLSWQGAAAFTATFG
jgi:hypothetical protein